MSTASFSSRRSASKQHPDSKLTERPGLSEGTPLTSSSERSYTPSQNNSFAWRGQPSETGAALGRTQTAPKTPAKPITFRSMPADDHPLRNRKRKPSQGNAFTGAGGQTKPERQPPAVYKKNGLVKPDNNGFSIPSRAQAQADTDRRRSIVKGGI